MRSFLPELAEANKILNNKDIENISDEESEHIEMVNIYIYIYTHTIIF